MKKSLFSLVVSAFLIISLSSCIKSPGKKAPETTVKEEKEKRYLERPNILVIMTDQQRYDQLGYSSNGYFDTPNLDRLAENGVIFENAYSCGAVCIPSRGSIMTGLEPDRYEKQGIFEVLQEGFWTMPHAMRENGYQTALIGKMHFNPIHSKHGFDYMRNAEHLAIVYGPEVTDDYTDWLAEAGKNDWRATHKFGTEQQKEKLEFQLNLQAVPFYYDQYYHPTNWIARETIQYLENRDKDKPYLLFASFPHPHQPYDPPAPYDTMYNIDEAVLPEVDPDINEQLAPNAKELMSASGFGYARTEKISVDLQKKINTYIRALIKQIDDAVGEIIEHIDLDNTVVIFTTDHGDYFGNRGLMLKTPGIPFDDIARVPFFISGAGVKEGHRVSNVTSSGDIALTCLEMAGVEVALKEEFNTQSLIPHLSGASVADDRTVYCESNVEWPTIRNKNYKYFYHEATGQEMLFDLEKDPAEKDNLADDTGMTAVLEDLRGKMQALLNKGIPDLPRYDNQIE